MSERPRVSVVLTSYNHADYLKEAIDSVLHQTFSDFELIIWDDASTDGSWQIITGYSDSRLMPFRNEVQKRGVWGLNKAITEIAAGDYIAIHHSDDIWEPQKLEKQVAFLDTHPEIGAVFSNASVITENGELLQHKANAYYQIFDQPNRTRYEWLNHFFCRGNALCHPSVLLRRECYGEGAPYRTGLGLLADLDLWVRVCLKYEIFILPEKLVRYRVRLKATNASTDPSTRVRRPFEFLQVLNNYRRIESSEELTKIFPAAEKYVKPDGCDIGFALGMTALELKPYTATELFGLNLLFEALNDPRRAKIIEERYGFTNKEFVALSSAHDVFSIQLMNERERHIEELARKYREISAGEAGQLAITLRRMSDRLVPLGSLRGKFARFIFQPILRFLQKKNH